MTQALQMKLVHGLFVVLGLMLILTWSQQAASATADGMYTVQVPVEGSSPAQLKAGYRAGLEAVLLRVAGTREVFGKPGVEQILDDAETYLQSYQYLHPGDGQPARVRMTFGSVGVTRALAGTGAAVWGANRPLTLAWIAVEQQGRRILLTDGENSETDWPAHFNEAARSRGLPLVFPSPEVAADRRLLSDVWGQFTGSLREASKRDHELLAVVRVVSRSGGWEASAVLQGPGIDETANHRADEPRALAQSIVDAWADILAARFAVAAGDLADATRAQVVLEGVHSVADYGQIKSAFERMNPVTSFGVAAASAGEIALRIGFSGELDQLREYIALDERFEPVEGPAVTDTESLYKPLYYRWQGGSPVAGSTEDPLPEQPADQE